MKLEIIDNFLSPTYFEYLNNYIVQSPRFEWSYLNNVTSSADEGDDWSFGYTHVLIETPTGRPLSPHFPAFIGALCDIQEATGLDKCTRARLDMTTKTPAPFEHQVHIDTARPNYSCILYMNDTDGDTIMYEETTKDPSAPIPEKLTERERIKPVPNRLVIFDGYILHTGMSPMKNKNRILLNTNFMADDQ